MKADLYNQKNQKIKQIDVPNRIFGVEFNPSLIHQVLTVKLANRRKHLAHTKTRAEVSGGGKKPWRQKGTGRARHGSIRSPIWKGGGVAFGPTKYENYTRKINKKMVQKALFSLLSKKLKENQLKIVSDLVVEQPKTKVFIKLIRNFLVPGKDSVLIIPESGNKEIFLAGRNVPKVKIIEPTSLSVYDLLKYQLVLLAYKSVEVIENHYKLV